MMNLKGIRYAPHLVILILSSFLLFSCDLTDEESCQSGRDEVEEWRNGHLFHPLFDEFDIEEGYQEEGYVEEIYLGGKAMISLNDVCTDHPVTVSAEVVVKPGTLQAVSKAYLYYVNPVKEGLTLGRFVTLARTSTDIGDNTLQIQPVDIPAFPDFYGEGFAGKLDLGILIFTHGLICDEEDKNWVTENWLSQVIQSAKITVSYTQY